MNNVIGQLTGIRKMMEANEDCFLTLTQMKAARAAMDNAMNKFIEMQMTKCMQQKENVEEQSKRFFQELIKNT